MLPAQRDCAVSDFERLVPEFCVDGSTVQVPTFMGKQNEHRDSHPTMMTDGQRPPRDSNPDLPPQGRACCRYTSGPSAGRPRTGVCHHPNRMGFLRWTGCSRPCVTPQACRGMTVRRARPADATGRTDRPRPGPRVGRQCAGERPRCLAVRFDGLTVDDA